MNKKSKVLKIAINGKCYLLDVGKALRGGALEEQIILRGGDMYADRKGIPPSYMLYRYGSNWLLGYAMQPGAMFSDPPRTDQEMTDHIRKSGWVRVE